MNNIFLVVSFFVFLALFLLRLRNKKKKNVPTIPENTKEQVELVSGNLRISNLAVPSPREDTVIKDYANFEPPFWDADCPYCAPDNSHDVPILEKPKKKTKKKSKKAKKKVKKIK